MEGIKLISKIPRQVESLGRSGGLNKKQPLESLGHCGCGSSHCGCGSSQDQRVDVSPEDQEEVTGLWVRPGLVSWSPTFLGAQAPVLTLSEPQFPLEHSDQHRELFIIGSHSSLVI